MRVDDILREERAGVVRYDVDEEQLKTIFSTVGPVVSFRLMHDKVTGRPKGYGFCEYADQETAYAAMRNLNNVECGGRPLRVDWADHELRNTEGVQRSIQRSGADVGRSNVKVNNKKLREFQQRLTDENAEHLALDVQTHSEIAALLDQWSTVELYQFLGHSQKFVSDNPEGARALFVAHPQLPLAINHVAYLLGFTSEPTFPMTPDDMIYAEERIKALRQHRVCPVKPIQPPRAVPISLVTDPTAQLQAGISNPMMMSGALPAGVLAAGASIAGARATTVGTISRVTSIGTSGTAPHAVKKPAVDIAALPADTKEALRKQLAQMTPAEVASLPADVREIMQQLAVSTGGSAGSARR